MTTPAFEHMFPPSSHTRPDQPPHHPLSSAESPSSPPVSIPTTPFSIAALYHTPDVVTKPNTLRAIPSLPPKVLAPVGPNTYATRVKKPRGAGHRPLITCPTCGKHFSRYNSFKRHTTEQKHGHRLSVFKEESPGREHLCPTVRCSRSLTGSGFKRATHLRNHLKSLCKVDISLAIAPSPLQQSPLPVAPDSIVREASVLAVVLP